MSEPSPSAAAKPDAATGPKVSSSMPLTIGIAVAALAAGAALGTLVLGPKLASGKHATATPAAASGEHGGESSGHGGHGKGEGKGEKLAVYRVDNIIVNPSGSEGAHFLMASVAIQVADARAEETLRAHEDEVRDRIIGVLERQTIESLSAAGSRDSLRNRIAAVLTPFAGRLDPARVYLPQFVIQ